MTGTIRRSRALRAALALLTLVSSGCGGAHDPTAPSGTSHTGDTAAETLRAEIVATLPHDIASFTEGLEIDGNVRYESSGLYGESTLRAMDRTSGAVLRTLAFPPDTFAEGLTRVDGRILVLTWQQQTAFVLDAATFAVRGRLSYDGEGWGMCALGDSIVTSNGSAVLTFRDPNTFAPKRTVDVRLGHAPVTNLNELECVNGTVYANVWKTDRIVRIDPTTGAVSAVVDVPALRPASTVADGDAVLNGIAYDSERDTFLLTGKRWPVMYEVKLVKWP